MTDSKENLQEKRVLVTGASGFIGRHLCSRLAQEGASVYGVTNQQRPSFDGAIRWIRGDLTDSNFVEAALQTAQPDILYHLAGSATGNRTLEAVMPTFYNNCHTAVNVLVASTKFKTSRIIVAGSMEEPDERQCFEAPVSPYAAAKWSATAYARMFHQLYGTPVTVARIFMVYGPGKQNENKLIPYVIKSLLRRETPEIFSSSRDIDWIYVGDVVEALVRIGYKEGLEGKTLDVGTGILTSVRDVCDQVKKKIGGDQQLNFERKNNRPAERIRKAEKDELHGLLGWEPKVNLDEGLEKTISWFKSELNPETEKK